MGTKRSILGLIGRAALRVRALQKKQKNQNVSVEPNKSKYLLWAQSGEKNYKFSLLSIGDTGAVWIVYLVGSNRTVRHLLVN